LEKMAAIQMVDMHLPTTDGRTVSNGTQSGPRIGVEKGPLCGVGAGLSR
jgi:hypothetical protein